MSGGSGVSRGVYRSSREEVEEDEEARLARTLGTSARARAAAARRQERDREMGMEGEEDDLGAGQVRRSARARRATRGGRDMDMMEEEGGGGGGGGKMDPGQREYLDEYSARWAAQAVVTGGVGMLRTGDVDGDFGGGGGRRERRQRSSNRGSSKQREEEADAWRSKAKELVMEASNWTVDHEAEFGGGGDVNDASASNEFRDTVVHDVVATSRRTIRRSDLSASDRMVVAAAAAAAVGSIDRKSGMFDTSHSGDGFDLATLHASLVREAGGYAVPTSSAAAAAAGRSGDGIGRSSIPERSPTSTGASPDARSSSGQFRSQMMSRSSHRQHRASKPYDFAAPPISSSSSTAAAATSRSSAVAAPGAPISSLPSSLARRDRAPPGSTTFDFDPPDAHDHSHDHSNDLLPDPHHPHHHMAAQDVSMESLSDQHIRKRSRSDAQPQHMDSSHYAPPPPQQTSSSRRQQPALSPSAHFHRTRLPSQATAHTPGTKSSDTVGGFLPHPRDAGFVRPADTPETGPQRAPPRGAELEDSGGVRDLSLSLTNMSLEHPSQQDLQIIGTAAQPIPDPEEADFGRRDVLEELILDHDATLESPRGTSISPPLRGHRDNVLDAEGSSAMLPE